MSTPEFGSLRRLRFSSEPCEGRTFSVTPWRARIARYRSAETWNELPSAPLVMTMVRGGAGRTYRNATQNAATTRRTNGPTVTTRSRQ
jgi:hypothetical protein